MLRGDERFDHPNPKNKAKQAVRELWQWKYPNGLYLMPSLQEDGVADIDEQTAAAIAER